MKTLDPALLLYNARNVCPGLLLEFHKAFIPTLHNREHNEQVFPEGCPKVKFKPIELWMLLHLFSLLRKYMD